VLLAVIARIETLRTLSNSLGTRSIRNSCSKKLKIYKKLNHSPWLEWSLWFRGRRHLLIYASVCEEQQNNHSHAFVTMSLWDKWAGRAYKKMLLQPLRWCCVECAIHHERDVREEQHSIYLWRKQAIIEWSRRVISIVACCHSAKLCAYAARDFRSQQWEVLGICCQATQKKDCDLHCNNPIVKLFKLKSLSKIILLHTALYNYKIKKNVRRG